MYIVYRSTNIVLFSLESKKEVRGDRKKEKKRVTVKKEGKEISETNHPYHKLIHIFSLAQYATTPSIHALCIHHALMHYDNDLTVWYIIS